MIDNKTNFFKYIMERVDRTPADVYKKLGWTRQKLFAALRDDRNPKPSHWPSFRRAVGLNKKEFWNLAADFHEEKHLPTEDSE